MNWVQGGNEGGFFELDVSRDVVQILKAFPKGPRPLPRFTTSPLSILVSRRDLGRGCRPQQAQYLPQLRLRLLRALDYDSPASPQVFQLRLTAADGGTPPKTNTALLTVKLGLP